MSEEVRDKIDKICLEIGSFLKKKNILYGNSALNPIGIFSKQSPESSICIRLDDKLKRVRNSESLRKNDVIDIIGYLVLLCVEKDWLDFTDLID